MKAVRASSDQQPPGRLRRGVKKFIGTVAATTVVASSLVLGGASVAQANTSNVTPAPNPAMADSCEINLAITLDYSTSMSTSQLTEQENAVKDLATALHGYPVSLALFNFGSNSPISSGAANAPLPLTSVETQAGIDAIHAKLDAFNRSGTNYTNWQAAFDTVRMSGEPYDALALVTDGNPTRITHPSVVQNTSDNPVNQAIVDGGVTAANQLKDDGTRIIGVAVTDNLNTSAYNAMLRQIPQVTGPTEGSDYHLGGLSGLQQTLLDIVNDNCAIIELDKVGTLSADGSTIDYDFTVRNDGVVTLTDVKIEDPLPGLSAISWGAWPGTPFVLEPGQEVTATATYTVTDDDRDSGTVHNLATAYGTPPSGGTPVEDEDPADVDVPPIPSDPSISLTKTADPKTFSAVGGVITYTFLVENDGDMPLTAVDVNDELVGLSDISFSNWPGAPGALLPGETVTGTATLPITQAHINAGKIDNTATATGTPSTPTGGDTPDPVTDTDDETVTGPVLNPALTLAKEADVETYDAGDTITYTFTLENTGNTTLSDVTVTDPLAGLSELTYTWPAGNTAGVLHPTQTATATATYTATQADVDRGFVYNAATATGNPPIGPDPENPLVPPVTPPAEETVVGPESDPSINLVKTATLSSDENTVTYTFVATNTGNVTLTDVVINDPLTGLSAISYDWSGATATGTLAPGEKVTGTATYAVQQTDRNAGSVVNLADTQGTPPNLIDPEDPEGPGTPQDPVTDEDPASVDLEQTTAINLVKEGELAGTATAQVGDLVNYTFTITNTGNVVLTDVVVTDEMLADAGVSITIEDSAWPGTAGTLNPGESVEGNASYPLTQTDIDAGLVDNVAIATGVSPIVDPDNPGETINPSDEDDVTVEIEAQPGLALTKSANVAEFDLGDTITYTFVATNTGNVTLTDVVITDPLTGLSTLTYDWTEATATGTLAPGEVVTATATYTATQADVDRGFVFNAATATGTPPVGPDPENPIEPPVTPPAEETVVGPEQDPAIELVKTGVLNIDPDTDAVVGDLVDYTFVATNIGNVTLTDVEITDPLTGLSAISYDWSEAAVVGALAPGEKVTGTATYPLTQADIDAGHVDNTATAEGTPPNLLDPEDPSDPGTPQDPVTDEDDETVIVPAAPAISLVKTGVLEGQAVAGETITYTFVATNTGNVTLTGVTITDPLTGLSAISYDWSEATDEGVLAPGEKVTGTATYLVTQADVDAGSVVNFADTQGTPPNAYDPEDPDGPGVPQEPVTDEDPEVVVLPQEAAIQLVKSGVLNVDADAVVGDLVDYTFVATNIGNVTLTDVEITDPLTGLSAISYDWSEAAVVGALAPGEKVTGTATYPLTQADIDAGHVDNTATAEGTPPNLLDPEDPSDPGTPQDPVTDEDDETVIVPAAPAISLVKTGELLGDAVAGDDIEFTLVATNTGNVTLTDVEIVDPLPGLSALTIEWPANSGVLEPGQSATATASYTLTQADVDRGVVINTATTNGTPPNAYDPEDPDGPGVPRNPVEDDDTVETPLPQEPAIELVKTSELLGDAAAGDDVEFTFVATNIGNVTLTDVEITDPMPGLSTLEFDWSGAAAEGELVPGESVTATASYTLTQADVDAGHVDNTATTTGTPPNAYDPEDPNGPGTPQDPVTDEDTVVTPLPHDPAIELVKTGAIQGEGLVGDKVNYTFVAMNNGNVTLSGVTITDPMPGLTALVYNWSDATAEGVLAPGESVSATASYTLTEADIRTGKVVNTADVIGYSPLDDDPIGGQLVTDEDTATVRTGTLPVTGGELALISLVGGGVLLLIGAGLIISGRRRKLVA